MPVSARNGLCVSWFSRLLLHDFQQKFVHSKDSSIDYKRPCDCSGHAIEEDSSALLSPAGFGTVYPSCKCQQMIDSEYTVCHKAGCQCITWLSGTGYAPWDSDFQQVVCNPNCKNDHTFNNMTYKLGTSQVEKIEVCVPDAASMKLTAFHSGQGRKQSW